MGPLLMSFLWVFVVWGFIQLFFKPGPVALTIYSVLGACLFSAYIVYDTYLLIDRALPLSLFTSQAPHLCVKRSAF